MAEHSFSMLESFLALHGWRYHRFESGMLDQGSPHRSQTHDEGTWKQQVYQLHSNQLITLQRAESKCFWRFSSVSQMPRVQLSEYKQQLSLSYLFLFYLLLWPIRACVRIHLIINLHTYTTVFRWLWKWDLCGTSCLWQLISQTSRHWNSTACHSSFPTHMKTALFWNVRLYYVYCVHIIPMQ